MRASVQRYLDEVRLHLHLDPGTERQVLAELAAHFEDKLTDLRADGLPEGAAERVALASFGRARSVARLLYEAHSRGSPVEAFLAFQPHLLAAALFAAHLWHSLPALAFVSAAYAIIATAGWLRGRPAWVHAWAGYAFFPLLVAGWLTRHAVLAAVASLAAGAMPSGPPWQLASILAGWIAGSLLLVSALVRVARRDWTHVSLMLLPLPVLALWLFAAERIGGFVAVPAAAHRWDAAMGSACLLLGVASALFIRARSRALKAGAVVAVGILCGGALARSIRGDTGLVGLFGVAVCVALVLLAPALLGAGRRRDGTNRNGDVPPDGTNRNGDVPPDGTNRNGDVPPDGTPT